MNKLLRAPIAGAILAFGIVSTGCSRAPAPADEPTEAQIHELQSFGREIWVANGTTQPPIDEWVGALPWLKFQRLELREDGAYFIMDETDSQERGYAVVDNVGVFMQQHPDPDNRILDTFVVRYRLTK